MAYSFEYYTRTATIYKSFLYISITKTKVTIRPEQVTQAKIRLTLPYSIVYLAICS